MLWRLRRTRADNLAAGSRAGLQGGRTSDNARMPFLPLLQTSLPSLSCRFLLLGLMAWFVLGSGHAASQDAVLGAGHPSTVIIDGSDSSLDLAGRSLYWIDESGRLDVEDIERRQALLPWLTRETGKRVTLGDTGALWVRFDAWVQHDNVHWELELARSGTDRVSLYHRDRHGQWIRQEAGDHLAVSRWHTPDRYPVFTLDTRTGGPVRYWLRIEHARVPFSGELVIHSHTQLRLHRIHQQFFIGAYFGMALLLSLVALANSLVFRDRSFVAYAIYTSLLALSMASTLGVGGQFLWPDSEFWNSRAEFVLMPVMAMAGLLFIRHVIQASWIDPRLDRMASGLAIVWIGLIVWDQLLPSTNSLQALSAAGAVTMVLTYALLWSAWRSGERWVRWIALGVLPMLLAGTIPVLRNFNLLSTGFLSQYGMVVAAAIEAPLLIYGLVQRSSIQHEAQARARALTQTEPLTGLTNHHHCILRLHEALVRAQRYQHRCALLVINLDNHEWFAQEHGREIADRALVLTGSLLRSVARDVDSAARIDDRTFALLMEGPVRPAQAIASATAILAGGLRPNDQLPIGATLRYKIVIALLPDPSIELPMDAQQHLAWLHDEVDNLQWDRLRNIATVNF